MDLSLWWVCTYLCVTGFWRGFFISLNLRGILICRWLSLIALRRLRRMFLIHSIDCNLWGVGINFEFDFIGDWLALRLNFKRYDVVNNLQSWSIVSLLDFDLWWNLSLKLWNFFIDLIQTKDEVDVHQGIQIWQMNKFQWTVLLLLFWKSWSDWFLDLRWSWRGRIRNLRGCILYRVRWIF